ncbi:hypothetical protein OAJ39_01565 [Alphaproteobacteria bacterium]|nr:hypothetical protein [Alphaproteobacteria bacterium]
MFKTTVLIIRNIVDCYAQDGDDNFAPMIDSIPSLLSDKREIRFLTITTIGSLVKLPGRSRYDFFFRYFVLGEKILRKLGSFSQKSSHVECYYWEKFLKRNNISKVFCIEPGQSFLKVCKYLSVEVCEVQHGVVGISLEHMQKDDFYSDFFLSWDKRSGHNASKRSFGKTTSLTGCNMALHYYKSKNPKNLICRLDCKSDKKCVLVSLQWGLFGPHLYSELELEDSYLPINLLKYMANSKDRYDYIFRLHPMSKKSGEVNKIFSSLRDFGLVENIDEFEMVSSISIFQQLEVVDLHVTLYSSVTIEASYFGIPTLLLDPALKKGGSREKYFEKEIKDGVAFIADIYDLEAEFQKAFQLPDNALTPSKKLFDRCERSVKKFLGLN